MYKSQPFKWLQSTIIYQQEDVFSEDLFALCQDYYSQRGNTHHYLGIAKGAMDTMNIEGMIKIKKLFYVLRALLAAKWCLEKNTIAPMSIMPLMETLPINHRQMLKTLIAIKAEANEGFLIKPDAVWMEWIKETETYCMQASVDLPRHLFEAELLNQFFRKTIQHYDHTSCLLYTSRCV